MVLHLDDCIYYKFLTLWRNFDTYWILFEITFVFSLHALISLTHSPFPFPVSNHEYYCIVTLCLSFFCYLCLCFVPISWFKPPAGMCYSVVDVDYFLLLLLFCHRSCNYCFVLIKCLKFCHVVVGVSHCLNP